MSGERAQSERNPHGVEPDGGAALAGLLEAARAGDERAWRSIVDLYARRVYALARSRLRGSVGARAEGAGVWPEGNDAAEEVTQSVFCTVAAKLSAGEYSERGRFESWLFRVAMNRIRDEVRRRKRHGHVGGDEELERAAAASDVGGEREAGEFEALRGAMERLGDADREVVELRHHAGLSFKAIADMLGEPIGTLLARHHRALRKLKDLLLESSEGRALAAEMSGHVEG